ncbi:hypothetical protein GPECTOR_35g941 [Gonium pectorale]|uniref:Protein kinase domain-containing protein n=1 Tax=Gonium pectorale TaxID=33097 RepID=A0A150GCK9_GONPE|nr:hypothetical protein GPECTOR_35g941 [Gonium pectorale]|eukprot:KXZ47503.1 hypothetical protein GPECTOR_35g941 [Gonium pectorale]
MQVRLAPGVVLTFAWVIINRWREGPPFQAPNMDLIASSVARNETNPTPWPILLFREVVWIQLTNAYSWDSYGKPSPANLALWIIDTPFLCEVVMTEDCVQRLQAVGCFYSMFPRSTPPPPDVLQGTPPPPDLLQSAPPPLEPGGGLRPDQSMLPALLPPTVERLVVTPLTPLNPSIPLGVRLGSGEGEVQLLPSSTLGRAETDVDAAAGQVLHIAIQVAQALAYLHPTILHRDLKPGNVLISHADSPHPVAKLADFGLSRLRATAAATQNPEVGTAPYIAPECFNLHNNVVTDRVVRRDIYAFGIVLWEMLAAQRPWKGSNIIQIAFAVSVHRARPPLDILAPERCPPKLRQLIAECWEHDPSRRPAAEEVAKRLALVAQAASTTSEHSKGGLPQSSQRNDAPPASPRRRRTLTVMAEALAAGTVVEASPY